MNRSNAILFAVATLALSLALPAAMTAQKKMSLVERGKYLVNLGGCNHCHSPKLMTEKGPQVDPAKTLSGHPAAMVPGAAPAGLAPDKWFIATTGDLTAWTGPWGTSYAANLTPDKATGLGSWTEAMFLKALRTGKHMGEGRMILPPMPFEDIAKLNDADLKAIFAYLQSLPAVENAVPDPIAPK
jgi:cytochrome c553